MKNDRQTGFTLIEMSIVLVIIGLIVGGILAGQDLIAAAQIRATASQLEKYTAATNTFKLKYDALPGDITPQHAAAFGFRYGFHPTPGYGDESGDYRNTGGLGSPGIYGWGCGETGFFSMQLSDAHLVEGNYNFIPNLFGDDGVPGDPHHPNLTPGIDMPALKVNSSAGILPITLRSGGNWFLLSCGSTGLNGFGWLSQMCAIPYVAGANGYNESSSGLLTPFQAFGLDTKLDDGLPGSGNVKAIKVIAGNYPEGYDETYIPDDIPNQCVTSGQSAPYNVANGTNVCALIKSF